MYTKPQLKNKWDALKTNWKIWKDLIGKETSLGWNSKKKTFRKECIVPKIEEKFDRMFMNTTTTGDYAWILASGFVPSEYEKVYIENVSLIESSGNSNENNIQGATWKTINKMDERKKKKKKAKVGAAMLFEQIDRLVDAVESYKSSETSSACNKTPEFTITQRVEALKDIPRLDKPLYFFATDQFCAKEKREVFMAMDEADKLSWLN
ncbi:hypothetical protein UlMin_029130 [Ulmus minor]